MSDLLTPATPELAASWQKWLRQTAFLTSAPNLKTCPPDEGYEVAFAGRSNAGKSSAINTLTQQRQLARSSKTPGRTQLLNFFTVDSPARRLVDLPGYGYAAVSEQIKAQWQKELGKYLIHRKSLQAIILLMDIRHPLQEYDKTMLGWAKQNNLPVHILLTKADKLNRGPAHNQLLAVTRELKKLEQDVTIQLFSSHSKIGVDQLNQTLAQYLCYSDIAAGPAESLDAQLDKQI